MKQSFQTLVILSFTFLTILSTEAQTKKYGTIYSSEKTGDSWGGTKKTNLVATLERNEKGEGPVSITLLTGNSENYKYNLTADFEAMTGEGKAFHRVLVGAAMYADPNWTSHTGSSEVNWVYLNKSIREILAEKEVLPFDIEIQFADGSAVKYLISK